MHWREITWMYLIQLVFALVIAFFYFSFFDAAIGSRPSVSEVLSLRWDYSSIDDLLREYASEWSEVSRRTLIIIIVYWLIAVLLHGALLRSFVRRVEGFSAFLYRGIQVYIPFWGYALIYVLVWSVVSIGIWGIYLSKLRYILEYWTDERWSLWIGIALTIIFMLWSYFVFVSSVFSRILYLRGDSWKGALQKGLRLSVRYYYRVLPSGLFCAILIGLLYYANLHLESLIGISSFGHIILFFVIQQAIVWAKISVRVAIYSFLYNQSTPQ